MTVYRRQVFRAAVLRFRPESREDLFYAEMRGLDRPIRFSASADLFRSGFQLVMCSQQESLFTTGSTGQAVKYGEQVAVGSGAAIHPDPGGK